MADPVSVGVIGIGGMGERHARIVADRLRETRLVAVTDPDRDRAERVAAPTGATVYTDAEALIAADGVDAVIVASPDATHAALALACIDHRKPALIEKPLATTLETCERIMEAEQAVGRRLLQLGFMREFDPAHIDLRNALAAGVVGAPLLLRGWHRNPPSPEPPTSWEVLRGAAVHDIYSARWMLDQEVTEIHVRGCEIHPGRSAGRDLQLLTMGMSRGAIASLEINKDMGWGYEVGVEVTGSTGLIATPPTDTPVVRSDGGIGQRAHADWFERFDAAYVAELTAWSRSVVDGRPRGASAYDGYATLAVALHGLDALESGHTVTIDLEPPRPLYRR